MKRWRKGMENEVSRRHERIGNVNEQLNGWRMGAG